MALQTLSPLPFNRLIMSGENESLDDKIFAGLDNIPAIARAGLGLIFRHYSCGQRRDRAIEFEKKCRAAGVLFLISADEKMALELNADGLHLPEYLSEKIAPIKTRHPNWIITTACHSGAALKRAAAADLALLSPVFPTQSHDGDHALGAANFSRLARQHQKPVFALGGIDEKNCHSFSRAAGIAGIGCFINEPILNPKT
jgi:thiamine-phosphate pyrophosphorylase